jgi:bifunctional UDP-N-acetylglucosamine pyrophosphorylase/glucosamine-1-phosphate N-acetyltransferase
MKVNVIDVGAPAEMEPLTCNRKLHEIPIAGITLRERLFWMFEIEGGGGTRTLDIRADFWPSAKIYSLLIEAEKNLIIKRKDGIEAAKLTCTPEEPYEEVPVDGESIILRFPWDILAVNEKVVGAISDKNIKGSVRERVSIDGTLWLGNGSVLLPGVFIEGNVVIGENCKIGPNCYIRGNTYIGDNCHVGQAVEIKNSLLMNNVSAGHLSYIGDSVICPHTNLGAGTISSNLRHDGKNHRSMVKDELIETGRRKLGVIIGDHVHTGIHTSIYPARKLWPETSTLPGEVVSKDKK